MTAEASSGRRSVGPSLNTLGRDQGAWWSRATADQWWRCFCCSSSWSSSCLWPSDCALRAGRWFCRLASRLLSAWCCQRVGTFCSSRSMTWGGIGPYSVGSTFLFVSCRPPHLRSLSCAPRPDNSIETEPVALPSALSIPTAHLYPCYSAEIRPLPSRFGFLEYGWESLDWSDYYSQRPEVSMPNAPSRGEPHGTFPTPACCLEMVFLFEFGSSAESFQQWNPSSGVASFIKLLLCSCSDSGLFWVRLLCLSQSQM